MWNSNRYCCFIYLGRSGSNFPVQEFGWIGFDGLRGCLPEDSEIFLAVSTEFTYTVAQRQSRAHLDPGEPNHMSTSRRFFLKSSTLAALVAGIGLKNVPFALGQDQDYPIPLEAQQDPVYFFRASTFEPYVKGIFQAPDARGRMVNLVLLSVTSYKPSPRTRITTSAPRPAEAFSLMFRASRALPPFTSIHKITHSALGTFDLALTHRVGTDQKDYYEAIINHKL